MRYLPYSRGATSKSDLPRRPGATFGDTGEAMTAGTRQSTPMARISQPPLHLSTTPPQFHFGTLLSVGLQCPLSRHTCDVGIEKDRVCTLLPSPTISSSLLHPLL